MLNFDKMLDIDFGCCKEAAPCIPYGNKKQEPDMKATYISTNVNAVDNQDANARQHLNRRLWEAYAEKENDLRKAFGLEDDEYPFKPEDLVARIKEGKYVIETGRHGSSIYWRDPAVKQDQEGYDEAEKKLCASRVKVEDDIAVLFPEQGLESLRAFEAETFH